MHFFILGAGRAAERYFQCGRDLTTRAHPASFAPPPHKLEQQQRLIVAPQHKSKAEFNRRSDKDGLMNSLRRSALSGAVILLLLSGGIHRLQAQSAVATKVTQPGTGSGIPQKPTSDQVAALDEPTSGAPAASVP